MIWMFLFGFVLGVMATLGTLVLIGEKARKFE
jgi:hypothetical protein